ncbi:hypothetical protein GIB67_026560 [Kingdonia uniflora]|uniref:Uncharacterized protein n=1 Tax=Kingdonia uniflora TaxID=39325 RepID=A0A7J7LB91_9MAGN|nr:hypothetical protein GIB67_026560 [Kingdonia uniflora]
MIEIGVSLGGDRGANWGFIGRRSGGKTEIGDNVLTAAAEVEKEIVVLKRCVQHGKIMTYEGLCLNLILRTSYIIQQGLSMPFRSQIKVSASSEIKFHEPRLHLDVWRVGLRLILDESGIVRSEELRKGEGTSLPRGDKNKDFRALEITTKGCCIYYCTPYLLHHRLCSSDRFLALSLMDFTRFFSNEEVVSHVACFIENVPEGDPAQYLIAKLPFQVAKKMAS